jgi:hypothetical protein
MFRRLPTCAVPGYAPLCVDSNDPQTVEVAFKARLMRKIPVADPALIRDFGLFVQSYLDANVPRARPMTYVQWKSSTHYDAVRLAQLDEAYDSLLGGIPTKHQRQHVDTFVKTECYPINKPGRMINSRCDKAKVWMGPKMKSIEDVAYLIPEFVKHIPVKDRPAHIAALRQANRHYFQTDFTCYESLFTPLLMTECECRLYRHVLSDDVEIDAVCRTLTGLNSMRTRTGVRATIRGRRMSGDMCTSLGNGFTNLMLAKYIAHCKGGSVTGFVEGDDGLFASDVVLTAEDYTRLGFIIKIEEVDDPCSASFCGMVFADSGQIIRDPRRFFQNFGWTRSFCYAGDAIMNQLLRAKALSAAYETPHCPIVGAMARYALKKTRGVLPRYVYDGYHDVVPPDEFSIEEFAPSMDTRLLFEREYGVSVSVQIACERAIDRGDMNFCSVMIPPSPELSHYASNYLLVT